MMMKERNMTVYTYDEQIVSDLHKDAYGFRPTSGWWQVWNASDKDGKQAIWNEVIDECVAEGERSTAREEAAIENFEVAIAKCMRAGATDRETAILWIVDSLDAGVGDDPGYVCYLLGLPYCMESLFEEAIRVLGEKVAA